MNTTETIAREILEYARLAPSVHNTQPWHFSINNSGLQLFILEERILEAGDPTKRELWISIGCCIEAIHTAAEGLGYLIESTPVQTQSLNQPIVTFTFKKGSSPNPARLELLKARHSYRGSMEKTTISDITIASWRAMISDIKGTALYVMQQPEYIQKVSDDTLKAMSLALANPYFRKELSELINYNWSPMRLGMHGYVLGKNALGSVWEKFSIQHGIGIASKAKLDQQRIRDASALLFIATDGDTPPYWLAAGRAYLRVALGTTGAGLAHSTIAAPIEAPGFHEDIEELLASQQRIQTMIRVGKATQHVRSSPRLSVSDLLT